MYISYENYLHFPEKDDSINQNHQVPSLYIIEQKAWKIAMSCPCKPQPLNHFGNAPSKLPPRKFNMKPKNKPLEKEIAFLKAINFQVSR